MNEMIRLAAIVKDSALKNAPATPERNASGVKMIMVAADEPARGLVNSLAALNTRERGSPSRMPRTRRTMCSTMTIASSMIRPTPAAMPPSVMMLKLIFRT